MIKESYVIPIFVVVQVIIGNAQYAYNPYHMDPYVDFLIDQGHVYHHYQPKTIVDPKNPLCKITCRSMFCEVTKGEMQGQITGSCFFPPFLTTCGGLPKGCGSCVEACGFKDNTKEIVSVSSPSTTIVDPKNSQCKITCRPFFCEVTKGEMQGQTTGSCFYPPYITTCGGLPTGCGSCVEACGFKDNTKEISSVSSPSTIGINTGNFYPDFTVQHPEISSEWIQINGKYYHFCSQHTTFLGAKSICTRMGGKLFIPQSQLMNEQIALIAKGKKFFFICEKM